MNKKTLKNLAEKFNVSESDILQAIEENKGHRSTHNQQKHLLNYLCQNKAVIVDDEKNTFTFTKDKFTGENLINGNLAKKFRAVFGQ